MGNADSKPRKVTVENANAPIFISDELRDRLSAAVVQGIGAESHAEKSPDDVKTVHVELPTGITASLLPEKSSPASQPTEDRMSLGEETALALLRLKQERDAELDRMQSEYFAKIRKAEEDFAAINNVKEEVYSKAVQETAELFDKPRMAVCGDMEKTVLDCYKANPESTLNCYTLVNQFHDCVAATRVREALSNRVVPVRSG